MDLDLVLEIAPEELEEFPEVTETDSVPEVDEEGTVVPGCSQHSFQTFKDHTKDTPQKEDTTLTTHPIRRNTPDRSIKDREPRRKSLEGPLSMRPEVMSDSDDGKIGDGKKGKTDPKFLPGDAIQLLQLQTAQSMDVMHELVRQLSKLKTKRNRRRRWRRL